MVVFNVVSKILNQALLIHLKEKLLDFNHIVSWNQTWTLEN